MRAEKAWPVAIAVALGVTVLANVALMRLAGGRNGAVVEPNYYRKAVEWDSTAARARASAALGWNVDVETSALDERGTARVRVLVRDRAGRPVRDARARIEAITNRDAARRLTAPLASETGGAYAVDLPLRHAGMWEFRVAVTRGTEVFVHSLRHDVVPHGGRG